MFRKRQLSYLHIDYKWNHPMLGRELNHIDMELFVDNLKWKQGRKSTKTMKSMMLMMMWKKSLNWIFKKRKDKKGKC